MPAHSQALVFLSTVACCPARSWTPLMWAAHNGYVEVMTILLYYDADESKRAQQGRYSGCALASCMHVFGW
jgi:hypothetical protein